MYPLSNKAFSFKYLSVTLKVRNVGFIFLRFTFDRSTPVAQFHTKLFRNRCSERLTFLWRDSPRPFERELRFLLCSSCALA
jgi:hypothetical protein